MNDNSQERLSPSTILILLLCFVVYSNKKNIIQYIKLFLKRKKRWNKALFLDLFLTDLYIQKLKSAKPNFGTLFLNAFAHIQHHYFLNSRYSRNELKNDGDYISADDDPLKRCYRGIRLNDEAIIKIGGLSKHPCDRTEPSSS